MSKVYTSVNLEGLEEYEIDETLLNDLFEIRANYNFEKEDKLIMVRYKKWNELFKESNKKLELEVTKYYYDEKKVSNDINQSNNSMLNHLLIN